MLYENAWYIWRLNSARTKYEKMTAYKLHVPFNEIKLFLTMSLLLLWSVFYLYILKPLLSTAQLCSVLNRSNHRKRNYILYIY